MRKRKFLLPVVTAAVCLVASLLGLRYMSGLDAREHSPVYEEVYHTSGKLQEGIRKIDYALYESLYRSGIRPDGIQFLSVEPRHREGQTWDLTEVLIRCRDSETGGELARGIREELRGLQPKTCLRKRKKTESGAVFDVFVRGFHTHKLILQFDAVSPVLEETRPRVAIIIDDLGYDPGRASALCELNVPLTFSVLPGAPYSRRIAGQARQAGHELMLHLPMEPKGYPSVKPGPGALLLTMDQYEIRDTLISDLEDVPGAIGVNNHMGSSFTEDREKMTVVLEVLKERGLFYIDSRTSSDTVGYNLARQLGLPCGRRNVFLDNDLEPKRIEMQMERLLNMATHRGSAIGIGHPHQETLKVLKGYTGRIHSGFQLVRVTELIR